MSELLSKLQNKKIAVLLGGDSKEREVSLRSGKNVIESLRRQGLRVIASDPAKEDFIKRLREEKVDLVFLALHGGLGENGAIAGLLETLKIPYTGSGVLSSALGMNKITSKMLLKASGINTPAFLSIDEEDGWTEKIISRFGLPVVAKPPAEGSSIDVEIVKDKEILEGVVLRLLKKYGQVLVEKFIQGRFVTVSILEIDGKPTALPILEIATEREFYDYEAKYIRGLSELIIPARLEEKTYRRVQKLALAVHKSLMCRGYSRVDFMISREEDAPYVLEINTLPGLTDVSDLPAQAKAFGIDYDELILRILVSALEVDNRQ